MKKSKFIILFSVLILLLCTFLYKTVNARTIRNRIRKEVNLKKNIVQGTDSKITNGKVNLPSEIQALKEVEQAEVQQGLDAFEHTLKVFKNIDTKELNDKNKMLLKTIALFHDIGKIVCKGSKTISSSLARKRLKQLNYSKDVIGKVINSMKGKEAGSHALWSSMLAKPVLERLGYTQKNINIVTTIIKNHNLLGKMDMDDISVSIRYIKENKPRQISTFTALEMYYRLTYADVISIPGLRKKEIHKHHPKIYRELKKQIDN